MGKGKLVGVLTIGQSKSKLKEENKISDKKWYKGDTVICRMEEDVFEAEIIGFYENSAVVNNLYNNKMYCCSFRNMIDVSTHKPLKTTKRIEAVSSNGNWKTAYLPTQEEAQKWGISHVKYDPRYKQ